MFDARRQSLEISDEIEDMKFGLADVIFDKDAPVCSKERKIFRLQQKFKIRKE